MNGSVQMCSVIGQIPSPSPSIDGQMEADGASPAMETKHAVTQNVGATGIQKGKYAEAGHPVVEEQDTL